MQIDESNFEVEVSQSDENILLYFSASWCGPCKIVSKLINEITNIKVCKIDIDDCPNLSSQYKIMSVPTIIIIKDKVVVARHSGTISKVKLQELIA